VFRSLSRLSAALDAISERLKVLTAATYELVTVQSALTPPLERLEALELGHARFKAECEGMLMQAEGQLKAARNAESRERALKKSYERLADPFDEGGEPPTADAGDSDIRHHDEASEEERLHAMRLDVAPSNKEIAKRAKFGVR